MKYLKLFIVFFKMNWSVEFEFRKNFIIRIITQFLYVLLQVVLIEIFFRFTNNIGSWTKQEVFVLAGIFRLIEGLFHILFHRNLMYLPESVNEGELDMYLSKPVNTLFMVSTYRQLWYELSTFVSGIVMLYLYLPNNSVLLWSWIMILSLTGLVVLYSIMLFICSLSFYIPRLTAVSEIWSVISKISRYPLDIFGRVAGPLLLVATIPARIILGKSGWEDVLIQVVGSIILFFTAYKFWQYSLKRYSSASS